MKKPRPHIPLHVRVRVAQRQLCEQIGVNARPILESLHGRPASRQLAELLRHLFGDETVHLDHNPQLSMRPYNPRIKDHASRYSPNANDPDALIYRTTHDHHIKTHVRGDGAQRSDTSERVHQRRLDRNRQKNMRPAAKITRAARPIPSRANPWGPKGSRSFRRT